MVLGCFRVGHNFRTLLGCDWWTRNIKNILLASPIPAPKLIVSLQCPVRLPHPNAGKTWDYWCIRSISKLNLCLNTWHCCFQSLSLKYLWKSLVSSILIYSHQFSRFLTVSTCKSLASGTSTTCRHLCWVGSCHQRGTVNICEYKAAKTQKERGKQCISRISSSVFSLKIVFPCVSSVDSTNFI